MPDPLRTELASLTYLLLSAGPVPAYLRRVEEIRARLSAPAAPPFGVLTGYPSALEGLSYEDR